MTYKEASEMLGKRNKRKLENNTYLLRDGEDINVRFHATNILVLHPDGSVVYNMGGYNTVTTRARMNRYGPARIWGEKLTTLVAQGREYIYSNGITVKGVKVIGYDETLNQYQERVKRKHRAFLRKHRRAHKETCAKLVKLGLRPSDVLATHGKGAKIVAVEKLPPCLSPEGKEQEVLCTTGISEEYGLSNRTWVKDDNSYFLLQGPFLTVQSALDRLLPFTREELSSMRYVRQGDFFFIRVEDYPRQGEFDLAAGVTGECVSDFVLMTGWTPSRHKATGYALRYGLPTWALRPVATVLTRGTVIKAPDHPTLTLQFDAVVANGSAGGD